MAAPALLFFYFVEHRDEERRGKSSSARAQDQEEKAHSMSMNYHNGPQERARGAPGGERGLGDESGIIVFGGGGRGCSGTGCLFWIVLSVGITIFINVILLLISVVFSSPGPGVNV